MYEGGKSDTCALRIAEAVVVDGHRQWRPIDQVRELGFHVTRMEVPVEAHERRWARAGKDRDFAAIHRPRSRSDAERVIALLCQQRSAAQFRFSMKCGTGDPPFSRPSVFWTDIAHEEVVTCER